MDGTQAFDAYSSWAGATGTYDFLVANTQNPSATGTVVIEGELGLSGVIEGDASFANQGVGVSFAFRDPAGAQTPQQLDCFLTTTGGDLY
jgi:hypothetical protein